MLGGAHLLVWTGVVLLVLVVIPATDVLAAWEHSQYVSLTASHCAGTDTVDALFATYDRQRNGPIATLDHVAFVLLVVGFGVDLIWWFWFARHPRRARAQPGGR
jgi:hypothetical protein